jgi:plasmid maintenance system killer protein
LPQKAIIVGSAPVSLNLVTEDLEDYYKIAINKSWRVRRDFDSHVFLKSLPEDELPPLAAGMEPIRVSDFTPALRNAGGLYLTSGSVAMVAGYWAIARRGVNFLSYYGCDLVFSSTQGGNTHYYGSGDSGPLVGNFQYNLRQRERSIRLLYWGLLHNVIVTNSSWQDGSLLCFPKAPLNIESMGLLEDILSSQETLRFMRRASNVWVSELRLRTPAFRSRQRIFENDPEALSAMNAILDLWGELEPFVQEFNDRVQSLVKSAEHVKLVNRDLSPSANLERQEANFDLVLHIGTPNAASSIIQKCLSDIGALENSCKVLSQHDRQNFFTKLNTSFANKTVKDFESEQRNIQIVQNFSKRVFEKLNIHTGDRVIINEEDALGSLAQCAYSGKTYRSPNNFLNNFAANLPIEPSDVHICIYSYADFFSKAYAELLKSSQKERFISLETFVAKVMVNLPSWTTTLDGVRLCFPTANIHVWCADDPAALVPSLLAAITGDAVTNDQLKQLVIPETQSAAVGEQVDVFMRILRRSGLEGVLETQSQNQRGKGTDNKRFEPWREKQKEHLSKLYDEDIVQIAGDDRFIFHRPGNAETKRQKV